MRATADIIRVTTVLLLGFGVPGETRVGPTAVGFLQQPAAQGLTPAAEALWAGINRIAAGDPAAAETHFQRALELASTERDRLVEGRAHRGLGAAFLRQARFPRAKSELEAAVQVFEEIQSTPDLAAALNELGGVEYFLNDRAAMRQHYAKALDLFEALGNLAEQANLCYNLSLVSDFDERLSWVRRGLDLAKKAGNPHIEGSLLHSWSDALFARGRLAESMVKVELAIERLEVAGNGSRGNLANALTSLGRLYRAHGQHDRSLESYRRAFNIQETIGERMGMIQSLNAMGAACLYLGRAREQRTYYERAVELARQTGSAAVIGGTVGNLASHLIDIGEAARGIEMLEEIARIDASNRFTHAHLAAGYLALGHYDRAIEAAGHSVTLAREAGEVDLLHSPLIVRARAHEKLGETREALADTEAAVALIDGTRAEAVPTDSMKLGFAREHQDVYSQAIALFQTLGRPRDALDVAERARGRAFADLLASRDAWAPSGIASRDVAAPALVASNTQPATLAGLATRGADGKATVPISPARPADDLRSGRFAPPLASSELAAVAARLHSTIVSYWVAPDAVYIWVVSGSGTVDTVRVAVTADKLTELVRRARSVQTPSDRRGDAAAEDDDADWKPRLRGSGLLSLGDAAKIASRTLYGLLIEPIRHVLPAAPGSLLTIIPHGPLFTLSFAALQDPAGGYLLERYAVHYAPAGAILQLTEKQKHSWHPSESAYLLVGDPASLPALAPGKPLPRLPGTGLEVSQIAALVGRSRVTTLVGAKATESEVRRLAERPTVIHFATHGVVRGEDSLESFLALDTGGRVGTSGSRAAAVLRQSETDPGDDGRLTVREIYDLHLAADLVVLSACGTGLGQVSGDGVAGLARAFIYAGTPSVVATLWDLADEPTARFMPPFYRSLQRQGDKALALRDAQLVLLRDLRAGRIKVATSTGTVTLREHPVLWAGFVLVGEP